jgi:hypothetical protein
LLVWLFGCGGCLAMPERGPRIYMQERGV